MSEYDRKVGEGILWADLPEGPQVREVACETHQGAGLRVFVEHHGLDIRCKKCLTVVMQITRKASVN
jgi:hypothetical protein